MYAEAVLAGIVAMSDAVDEIESGSGKVVDGAKGREDELREAVVGSAWVDKKVAWGEVVASAASMDEVVTCSAVTMEVVVGSGVVEVDVGAVDAAAVKDGPVSATITVEEDSEMGRPIVDEEEVDDAADEVEIAELGEGEEVDSGCDDVETLADEDDDERALPAADDVETLADEDDDERVLPAAETA
eukprot:2681350-Rhodomonas_salina.5